MSTPLVSPDSVLTFWFEELAPAQWWKPSEALDQAIEARFGDAHRAARRCELWAWRETPQGRLAEILLLDQFSRNLHRESPEAFASDPLALALAQTALAAGADRALADARRAFLLMPFVHSESPVVHAVAASLFAAPGLEAYRPSQLRHSAVIARFGRYPHRNAVLGRASTEAELAFLQTEGSSF